MNLGDCGPDSGALLPVSLPEVLVSLLCEVLSRAIVIGPGIGPPGWLGVRTGVIPVAAPADAPAVGGELTGNGCNPGCGSSWYISVRAGSRHADELEGVARWRGEEHGCRLGPGHIGGTSLRDLPGKP